MSDVLKEGHEIVKLFTWPVDNEYKFNKKVLYNAAAHNIPVQFTPLTLTDLHNLKTSGCDALISACYPGKIPPWEDYLNFAVNVHPALLPEGRGPWPLPWAILKECKTFGVTVHKISNVIDAGDIISQGAFDMSHDENLETLSAKCQLSARRLINDFVRAPDQLWKDARPQEKPSTDKSCYWVAPQHQDRNLDWNKNVAELDKIIRAFGKFNCYAVIDSQIVSVQSASFWKEDHKWTPGSIVHEMNREIVIAVRNGMACIRFYKSGYTTPGDYFPPRAAAENPIH